MHETYSALAYFAQTWGLVLMVVGFIGVLVYTFAPSRKKQFDEAAHLPLEKDD